MRVGLGQTLTLAIGTGASSLLRIAFIVYAGRMLGPAAYADFYACLSVVFLFATGLAPVSGSITLFTSRYLAREEMDRLASLGKEMPQRVKRYAIGLGAIGLVGIYPLVQWLHLRSYWSALLVVLILPAMLMLDLPRGILRGLQAFKAYSINLVQEASIRLVLGVLVFTALPKAEVGLAAYLVAALFMLPISRKQLRMPQAAGAERADFEAIERTMLPLLGFAFAVAAFQNIDVLFVKSTFAAVPAGQYGAASSLARLVALAFMPFGVKLLPVLTTSYSRDLRLLRPLAASAGGFLAAAALVVTAYAWRGEEILQRVYGETYAGAGELLLPLSLAITATFLVIMIGQAFTAMHRFHFVPFISVGLVLEAIGLWWQRHSLMALAWTVFAAQLVILVVTLLLLLRTISSDRTVRDRQ